MLGKIIHQASKDSWNPRPTRIVLRHHTNGFSVTKLDISATPIKTISHHEYKTIPEFRRGGTNGV